jgi:hypothetical protein
LSNFATSAFPPCQRLAAISTAEVEKSVVDDQLAVRLVEPLVAPGPDPLWTAIRQVELGNGNVATGCGRAGPAGDVDRAAIDDHAVDFVVAGAGGPVPLPEDSAVGHVEGQQ